MRKEFGWKSLEQKSLEKCLIRLRFHICKTIVCSIILINIDMIITAQVFLGFSQVFLGFSQGFLGFSQGFLGFSQGCLGFSQGFLGFSQGFLGFS